MCAPKSNWPSLGTSYLGSLYISSINLNSVSGQLGLLDVLLSAVRVVCNIIQFVKFSQ